MTASRLYIVRNSAGTESGPFDQDTLLKQAENGTLDALDEIRSTLLPQWGKAGDLPFLKSHFQKQMDQIYHPAPSFFQKMKKKLMRRCDIDAEKAPDVSSRYSRVGILLRFLAGITDLILLVLLFIGAAALICAAVTRGIMAPEKAGAQMILSWAAVYFLYFTLTVSCLGQTIGQKTWGIFLMQGKRDLPFYAGRIFFYALLLPPLALLTPITVKSTSSGRSWQEVFSGLTMVKAKYSK